MMGLALIGGAVFSPILADAAEMTVAALRREMHFHGIGIDPADSFRAYRSALTG